MKKIVGTIAAIALAASSAFAGVGIGSWGRAIWAPVTGDANSVKSFEGVSWGDDARVGISVHGESENIGFTLDILGDGGKIAVGDQAMFWAQPFSWLTVKIGKALDDTGRGNAGFGVRDWYRATSVAGFDDDFTFKRFGILAGGAIVKVTPVEGLWAIAAIDVNNNDTADKTYANAQYGAGYVIDGIGHIRAQFIGASKTVNAAFDLTAVDNLLVSVGAFIPVEGGETVIAAYAKVNLDALTIHVGEQATINGSTFANKAAVGLDADLGNGLAVNCDVRVENATDTGISFMAAISKGLTGGSIGVGFEGALTNLSTSAAFAWSVPVRITAGF